MPISSIKLIYHEHCVQFIKAMLQQGVALTHQEKGVKRNK